MLGDTVYGLTGSEIGYILKEIEVPDPSPALTKWKRMFNALAEVQNKLKMGNHLI